MRALTWVVTLLVAWPLYAATSEQKCRSGRAKAAGKYAKCLQNVVAKVYYEGGGAVNYGLSLRIGKCVTKYAKTYDRLQAKALASPEVETCDAARYVDNGDGTVTDSLTWLRWEKKTDDATVHDAHNQYRWSSTGAAADGEVFTVFLATLNGAGFAGQYDWRLPTVGELLSIVRPPAFAGCFPGPCIDPIFGPTFSTRYWSSSELPSASQVSAWYVYFADGGADFHAKTHFELVRAVRGGS